MFAVSGIVMAFIFILAVVLLGNKESQGELIETINSHEIEIKPEEEKEVYVNDYIYRNSFSLTVDKHSMDKHPEFMKKASSEIVYHVPMNFKQIEEDSYAAYDETAAIKFFSKRVDKNKTISDIMKEGKRKFTGNIIDEESDVNWYIFLAQIDEVQYYYCEKLQNGETIGFLFSYPVEYLDIYDDYYFAALVEGLKFPLEVIEIN